MNENIDLTKILDGCPKGTEFYHTIFGRVYFNCIDRRRLLFPIVVSLSEEYYDLKFVTEKGESIDGKCCLFPSKEQRDWSKFKCFLDKQKTMKPFNLEEYLKDPSKKVITRDGREARIVCTDKKGNDYPIIALIEDSYRDSIFTYDINGKSATSTPFRDLFFAPEKKEGWINIYVHNWLDGKIYPSEEKAFSMRDGNMKYITTIKIKWEE